MKITPRLIIVSMTLLATLAIVTWRDSIPFLSSSVLVSSGQREFRMQIPTGYTQDMYAPHINTIILKKYPECSAVDQVALFLRSGIMTVRFNCLVDVPETTEEILYTTYPGVSADDLTTSAPPTTDIAITTTAPRTTEVLSTTSVDDIVNQYCGKRLQISLFKFPDIFRGEINIEPQCIRVREALSTINANLKDSLGCLKTEKDPDVKKETDAYVSELITQKRTLDQWFYENCKDRQ